MMRLISVNHGLSTITLLLTVGIFSGCATTTSVNDLKAKVDANTQAAQVADQKADAAMTKADLADHKADKADQKADQALQQVNDLNAKIDRMFEKAMKK